MADGKGRPWWASLLVFATVVLTLFQPELIPVTIPLVVILVAIT